MRACPIRRRRNGAASRFDIQRRSLTPTPLPSGRGDPALGAQKSLDDRLGVDFMRQLHAALDSL
jgi:hypothetical protein